MRTDTRSTVGPRGRSSDERAVLEREVDEASRRFKELQKRRREDKVGHVTSAELREAHAALEQARARLEAAP